MDLERTIRDLGAARAEQEAVLAQAAALGTAPGEERAIAALRAEMRPARGAAGRRSIPSARWIALAAAAVIGIVFVARWVQHDPPRGDVQLGSGRCAAVAPLGHDVHYGEFRWLPATAVGETAVLEVWARGDDGARKTLLHLDGLTGDRVTLESRETDAWPREISWSVTILDSSGALVATTGQVSAAR